MRILIVNNPTTNTHDAEFRQMLKKVAGKWLPVEIHCLFPDQYNTPAIPNVTEFGLRIMEYNVQKIDYEGDVHLEAIHKLMRSGIIKCHHYKGETGTFVDIQYLSKL